MSAIKTVTKFTVTIAGKEKTFNTEAEALAAIAKVELAATAQAYVDSLRDKDGNVLGDKDKKGKFNVVLDYLAYNAGLSAGADATMDAETL